MNEEWLLLEDGSEVRGPKAFSLEQGSRVEGGTAKRGRKSPSRAPWRLLRNYIRGMPLCSQEPASFFIFY